MFDSEFETKSLNHIVYEKYKHLKSNEDMPREYYFPFDKVDLDGYLMNNNIWFEQQRLSIMVSEDPWQEEIICIIYSKKDVCVVLYSLI